MPSPLRCCVIDDEPLAAELVASYIKRTPSLTLTGVYNAGSEAMKDILNGNVDILFLDVEMPQINGLEFAKVVPPTTRIIFTTAYDRYAVQSFKVNAVDYLLKPINYDEFLLSVNRVLSMATAETAKSKRKREFLLVRSEYKLIQVRMADILFVEGLKDYVKIYIYGQPKPLLTLMSMKSLEQALGDESFMRVHRSYIVNTSRISIIERNTIYMGEHVIPVSETYRAAFSDYVASLNPEE